jgi:hypothetical protein
MAYASFASPNMVARESHPGRHVPAARNLAATTDDESYHGSTSELPPATSHGYTEWDFSGVPGPVMFQRFLDTADYRFGYSDNSSAGSYDPARECFVVIANDKANAVNAAEAGDGEVPLNPGTGPHQGVGPSVPPPHHQGAPTSTRSWPKRASLRPNSRRSTAQCDYYAPPSLGKPPRAVNARASWASKPASASTLTSTSTAQARPHERARSSSLPRRCCGPCSLLQRPRRGTCTARRRRSSSKRPCNRLRARHPAFTSRGARETTGRART